MKSAAKHVMIGLLVTALGCVAAGNGGFPGSINQSPALVNASSEPASPPGENARESGPAEASKAVSGGLSSFPVTLKTTDKPLGDVVETISSIARVKTKFGSSVDAQETKVTLDLNQATAKEAFDQIAQQTGLTCTVEGDTVLISRPQEGKPKASAREKAGSESTASEEAQKKEIDRLLSQMDKEKEDTGAEAAKPSAEKKETQPKPANEAEKIIKEVKREEKLEKQLSRELVKRGDEKRAEGDYKTAKKLYAEALKVNPGNTEAAEKKQICEMMVGETEASGKPLLQEWEETRQVEREARLNEIDRMIEDAKTAMTGLRLEKARFLLEQAKVRLALLPPTEPIKGRKKRVSELLTDAKELLRRKEVQTAKQQQKKIQEAIEQDQKYRNQLKEQKVKTLLERASEAYRKGDYKQCISLSKAVLDEKPNELQARAFLIKAREMEETAWEKQIEQEMKENEKLTAEGLADAAVPQAKPFDFPDSQFWKERVQQRVGEIAIGKVEESEAVKQIKRRLATAKITLDFEDRPLSDALEYLRKFTQINIHVDRVVDPEQTRVTLHLNQARLKDALDLMMTNTGLAYTFRNDVLFITQPGKARGQTVLKIYNVTDILSKIRDFPGPKVEVTTPDEATSMAGGGMGGGGGSSFEFGTGPAGKKTMAPEELRSLVENSTGGSEVWTPPMSIKTHRGQLLVEATVELHKKVDKVLTELRRDRDLFVVVKARFVDVHDDFLEEIGIDYRNLSQRNTAWTDTYSGRIHDNRTGGQGAGFTDALGVVDPELVGRMQNIFDGYAGLISGDRITGGPGGVGGLTFQYMQVEPYQLNAIVRAVQEEGKVKSVVAPEIVAHNGQQVFIAVTTQRSYIADYELVSGGTTYTLTEVADPIVQVNEEGVVLDVRPTVSANRKYITIDVKPTLASLIGGVISTVLINLGTVMAAAMQVPIGLPKMSVQRTWTSVTVPDGGSVLLGGFRSMNEQKHKSSIPIIGKIPLLNLLASRRGEVREKRSLVIVLTATTVDLRKEEAKKFRTQ